MIILSIASGHDAAIAIYRDTELLLNWELERYTRVRHDYGYMVGFLERSLAHCNLELRDVDLLCVKQANGAGWSERDDCQPLPTIPVDKWTTEPATRFKMVLHGREFEALTINHHLAHVASAYYTSPFSDANIVTWDGGGDAECYSFCAARDGKLQIESFGRRNDVNICLWWSRLGWNSYRFTRLNRFDPGSGSGKIMALAAFGACDPAIVRLMDENRFVHEDLSDSRSSRSQAVAASLQRATEDLLTEALQRDRPSTSTNLCLAGGLALNCVANTRCGRTSGYQAIHVPPMPNDAGLPIGMALYALYHELGHTYKPGVFNPYTGPQYSREEVDKALAACHGMDYTEDPRQDVLLKLLIEGNIVPVWRGRSECGPRALGNRSLLARPDGSQTRELLNTHVKRREWYRPYAGIILPEAAPAVLEDCRFDSPYMSQSYVIRPEWEERMRAICHIDCSTRPQLAEMDLVRRFYQHTGLPALLNTSFNCQEPMVETPQDALRTFLRLPLRYLYLEPYLVTKR